MRYLIKLEHQFLTKKDILTPIILDFDDTLKFVLVLSYQTYELQLEYFFSKGVVSKANVINGDLIFFGFLIKEFFDTYLK